jgi:hypothetical protein
MQKCNIARESKREDLSRKQGTQLRVNNKYVTRVVNLYVQSFGIYPS